MKLRKRIQKLMVYLETLEIEYANQSRTEEFMKEFHQGKSSAYGVSANLLKEELSKSSEQKKLIG